MNTLIFFLKSIRSRFENSIKYYFEKREKEENF
jgi:hypothetical protein